MLVWLYLDKKIVFVFKLINHSWSIKLVSSWHKTIEINWFCGFAFFAEYIKVTIREKNQYNHNNNNKNHNQNHFYTTLIQTTDWRCLHKGLKKKEKKHPNNIIFILHVMQREYSIQPLSTLKNYIEASLFVCVKLQMCKTMVVSKTWLWKVQSNDC